MRGYDSTARAPCPNENGFLSGGRGYNFQELSTDEKQLIPLSNNDNASAVQ